MKSIASGALGLTFATCIYLQAYNVSIGTLNHMQNLMDSAAAQLDANGLVAPNSVSPASIQGGKQQLF